MAPSEIIPNRVHSPKQSTFHFVFHNLTNVCHWGLFPAYTPHRRLCSSISRRSWVAVLLTTCASNFPPRTFPLFWVLRLLFTPMAYALSSSSMGQVPFTLASYGEASSTTLPYISIQSTHMPSFPIDLDMANRKKHVQGKCEQRRWRWQGSNSIGSASDLKL